MSIDVTWPRHGPISDEEKLLREIFEYIGVDLDRARNAELQTYVERYRDKQATT